MTHHDPAIYKKFNSDLVGNKFYLKDGQRERTKVILMFLVSLSFLVRC